MADFARGERLRGLREGRHLSQEEAAHDLGVSVKSVRTWEKGGGIRWHNAQALGAFFGVDAESLVSREPGGPAIVSESAEAGGALEQKIDLILGQQRELLATVERMREEQRSLLQARGRGGQSAKGTGS